MRVQDKHPAEQICELMKRVIDMGMGTVTGGNVSILDDDGNVWMSPRGITKVQLTPAIVAKYGPDDTQLTEMRGSLESKINIGIHRVRPDLKGVVHGHTPAMLAYMLMRKSPELNVLAGVGINIVRAAYTPFRMPGSDELRDVVLAEYENGADVVYLENHGIFVGGTDLYDAYAKTEAIEFACQVYLNSCGMPENEVAVLSDSQIDEYKREQDSISFETKKMEAYSADEMNIRNNLCFIAHYAYQDHLTAIYTSSVSMRISENEYVFTPKNCDFLTVTHGDLVKVVAGVAEEGKELPADAKIHLAIYERHPEINALLFSTPLYGMSYAVTKSKFSVYADFEIFMSVHEPAVLPFEATAEEISAAIQKDTPVVLVANRFAITSSAAGLPINRALSIGECLNNMGKADIQVKSGGNIMTAPLDYKEQLDATYMEMLK